MEKTDAFLDAFIEEIDAFIEEILYFFNESILALYLGLYFSRDFLL